MIPAFKQPQHFSTSTLLGHPPLERDILLYFRGDLGDGRLPRYSRGIRQNVFRLAHEQNWADKYKIYGEAGGARLPARVRMQSCTARRGGLATQRLHRYAHARAAGLPFGRCGSS